MNANELRLGNFIQSKSVKFDVVEVGFCETNNFKTIKSLTLSGFNIDICSGILYSFEAFEGIPLTEEWLTKFEFNKNSDNDPCNTNYATYDEGTYTFNYCIDYYFDEQGYVEYVWKEIKYVHQLQNLYFALTGEELTLQK